MPFLLYFLSTGSASMQVLTDLPIAALLEASIGLLFLNAVLRLLSSKIFLDYISKWFCVIYYWRQKNIFSCRVNMRLKIFFTL